MKWLIEHLERQGQIYLLVAAMLVGLGAFGGSVGQQWLTSTIDGRINIRLVQVENQMRNVDSQLRGLSEVLLVRQIQEVQKEICLSPRQHLRDTMTNLQQQYEQLRGRQYVPPPCDQLLDRDLS